MEWARVMCKEGIVRLGDLGGPRCCRTDGDIDGRHEVEGTCSRREAQGSACC